jgi:hypothetical protein
LSQLLPGRSLLALAVVCLTLGVLASQAHAQTADRTVEAYGQATVVPKPRNAKSDASIAAAVKVAAATAVSQAVADAKVHAAELATAAGVTLGELLSIGNVPAPAFPFYSPFQNEGGTFGDGKYCGKVTTGRRVVGKNGKARIVRKVRRVCRIPVVTRQVELTYAIAS